MTKKDYERIATAIWAARAKIAQVEEPGRTNEDMRDGVAYAAEYIASALAQEPGTRFDRARFLAACGVQS